MNIKLRKTMCFTILSIIFIVFIAFNLIINPAGWLISFLIYSVYDGFINGTVAMKIISMILFLMLFSSFLGLIKFFIKSIVEK